MSFKKREVVKTRQMMQKFAVFVIDLESDVQMMLSLSANYAQLSLTLLLLLLLQGHEDVQEGPKFAVELLPHLLPLASNLNTNGRIYVAAQLRLTPYSAAKAITDVTFGCHHVSHVPTIRKGGN